MAKSRIEKTRRELLSCLGADPRDKLIFTSGGTESSNMILRSAAAKRGHKTKLVVSCVEHSCVYNTARELEREGVEIIWLDVNSCGEIDWQQYQEALDQDPFLVVCMLVNNETGFIFPIKEMAAKASEKKIPFFTDAVCAVGKIPVDFTDLGVSFLSFSSHKFGALKGTGGLICKESVFVRPLLFGGSQESGKRAGTENLLGIVSSSLALQESLTHLDVKQSEQKNRREQFIAAIHRVVPESKIWQSSNQLDQTISVSIPGFSGNVLLANLDLEGVQVSYGSACASGSLEVSRPLIEMGLPLDLAEATLRLSFGSKTSEDDVRFFENALETVVSRMKRESAA